MFNCTKCDYTTKRKSNLGRHDRLKHADKKQMFKCPGCGDTYTSEYYLNRHSESTCKHTLTLQRWREEKKKEQVHEPCDIYDEPSTIVKFSPVLREHINFEIQHITLEEMDTLVNMYQSSPNVNNPYKYVYQFTLALIKLVFENKNNRCIKRELNLFSVYQDNVWVLCPEKQVIDRLMVELSIVLFRLLRKFTIRLQNITEQFTDNIILFIETMKFDGYVQDNTTITKSEKQLIRRLYRKLMNDIKHHLLTLQ